MRWEKRKKITTNNPVLYRPNLSPVRPVPYSFGHWFSGFVWKFKFLFLSVSFLLEATQITISRPCTSLEWKQLINRHATVFLLIFQRSWIVLEAWYLTLIHNTFVWLFVCPPKPQEGFSWNFHELIRVLHCTSSQKFHSDWVAMGVVLSRCGLVIRNTTYHRNLTCFINCIMFIWLVILKVD